MSTLLLDTLRKAELDQYFTNFSTNGITQLESLAQLSMQDYNSLGIVSIQDRKKLFQLVQSLRQELPTKENGLVSSATNTTVYRRQSRPNATGITTSSPAMAPPSPYVEYTSSPSSGGSPALTPSSGGMNGMPDLSAMSMSRRPVSNSGSSQYQSPVMTTATPPMYQQQQQQQHSPKVPSSGTRSRSRTLPDQHQRPDFTKTMKPTHPDVSSSFSPQDQSSSEEEDDEDAPEIRRSSNPLLNPYGVPIQSSNNPATNNKIRSPFAQKAVPSGLGQSDLNQKIRVCVRKRPLNKKELERGEKDISPTAGIRSININEPKMKVDLTKYIEQHSFTFDDVFDLDDSNDQIYQRTAQPLVKYVFNGGKATCFAYGQTGSGKTFTMLDPQHGLYVLAARDVFALLCQPQYQHLSAYIGFYEIYQGQLYDLLNARKKLHAREDGKQNVVIAGLKEYVIKNVEDLMKVFEYGSLSRSTGSTGANSDSSRSHAILQILLKPTKNRKIITGKLSFIDLAGSERGADRGETDVKTRMEGAEINKSLLALKECIRALDQDKRHTPFRQSKLTQVLKDSFVGHSRTCMIATISPNQGNSEHTLNTLRYADRVKELKGERDRRGVSESAASASARTRRPSTQDDDDAGLDDYTMDSDYKLNQPYGNETYYSNGSNNNDNNLNNNSSSNNDYALYENHGAYSDDPDLYHDDDDDLFLGDEDFPSDGDVHILDEDFPHETNLSNDDDHDSGGAGSPSSAGLLRPRYFEDDDDDSFSSNNIPKRQPTPYHHHGATSDVSTTGGGLARPSMTNERPIDDIDAMRSRQSSGDRRRSMDRSSITSRTSSHHLHYQQQQHRNQPPPVYDDTPLIDPQTIEEFIKFHRAEIRETGECSKRETKLMTHFSLTMASRQEEESSRRQQDTEKTRVEFQGYLNNLDEVLDMKMAAIDALRDRIRLMLGEEGF